MSDPELRDMARRSTRHPPGNGAVERNQGPAAPQGPNDSKTLSLRSAAAPAGTRRLCLPMISTACTPCTLNLGAGERRLQNINETEIGGIKEVSFVIEGEGAYSRLKFESGVHRVQRVPDTEASGRIHTSTVTWPCCPSGGGRFRDQPADLQIDTFRSLRRSRPCTVNKTESAIRITHLPTARWWNARMSAASI